MGRIFADTDDQPVGVLHMIDPSQPAGAVTTVASLGNHPAGMAFDGSRIWVANALDHTISIITPGPTTPWAVQAATGFVEPLNLLYDGNNMWVTDWASNGNGPSGWIKKLDSNGNVILTVNMDNNPVKPVFDGTKHLGSEPLLKQH